MELILVCHILHEFQLSEYYLLEGKDHAKKGLHECPTCNEGWSEHHVVLRPL